MERRRKHLRRVRGTRAITAMIAALAVSAFVPAMAFGQDNLVNDLVEGVEGILGGGGDGSAEPTAGSPPDYTPPLHGTNPHGQGTSAVIDLTPEDTEPLGGDTAGSDSGEDVILGRSRGEQQDDGSYHGRITILALFGSELLGVETNEGETASGPLQPLQDALDEICTGSGGQLCLTLLAAHSSTTGTGSTNSFEAVGAQIGTGENSISASVAGSNGNINEDANCQTAHGDSHVADANVLGAVTAGVAESSSDSTACNDGTTTQSNSSSVIELQGEGVPIPAEGCADGTPNTVFDSLSPIIATVCNADDSNGAQAAAPYGVREALSVFLLIVDDIPAVKATTAASESLARAPGPGEPPTEPPVTPPGEEGPDRDRGPGDEDEADEDAGPAAGGAQPGAGELAFTGANLAVLGLIGGALMLGGVMLARASTRRHRRATV